MAYFVERLNLQVGGLIQWSKVEPDVVVDVIDKPTGHIVVAQKTGNVHAWWGSWGRDPQNPNRMRKGLAHHGGRYGWDDIQKPINQHNAVLERYRWGCENVVIEVHKKFASAKADWDESSDDLQRGRIVEQLTGGLFGINLLRTLQVQPFRREVEELFAESRIDILSNLWISVNYPRISTALTRAEGKLFRWSSRIQNRRLGAKQPPLPMPSATNPAL